eukprot:CAMPEP_0182553396 /NCGR_PEP_ID=MMETSP1323-20130603/49461_1 /TAXON_ID=236787 /ORGANISM="Florenciella parvula, Strain RCC1693" /LENGTH=126 /DNA_ID=CAMNT_0024765111 /DNA_START=309 /DNA_END=689 /DNA_ORIENTATION=-
MDALASLAILSASLFSFEWTCFTLRSIFLSALRSRYSRSSWGVGTGDGNGVGSVVGSGDGTGVVGTGVGSVVGSGVGSVVGSCEGTGVVGSSDGTGVVGSVVGKGLLVGNGVGSGGQSYPTPLPDW